MDHVLSELCYKVTNLQKNYIEITFKKSHGKKIWEPEHNCVVSKSVGLHCTIIPDLGSNHLKNYLQDIKVITSGGQVKINFDKQVQGQLLMISFPRLLWL